jgi:hypothetical protein
MESYKSHNVKKKCFDSTGYSQKTAIFQKIGVELGSASHYILHNRKKDKAP